MAKERKVPVSKDRDKHLCPDNNENNLDKWAYEMVEMQEKKERVYHYTSMDTFFKIVEGAKDDFFVFRAGSLYTMNDSQEMLIGYEYIKKYLPDVEKELGVCDEDKIFNMTKNLKTNKNIKENYGSWVKNDDTTNFIVSFSQKPDILPMWALYGDKGRGVCLEFSPYIIKEFYKDKLIDKNLQIESCRYNEKDIEDFVLRNMRIVYRLFLSQNDKEKRNNPYTKATYLTTMCCIIGAYVKHPSFEYEKEVRMNIFKNIKDWKFDDTEYHRCYTEIPIPLTALKGVIVGPAANIYDFKNSIILRLRTKGISLEPIHSKIPFRLL